MVATIKIYTKDSQFVHLEDLFPHVVDKLEMANSIEADKFCQFLQHDLIWEGFRDNDPSLNIYPVSTQESDDLTLIEPIPFNECVLHICGTELAFEFADVPTLRRAQFLLSLSEWKDDEMYQWVHDRFFDDPELTNDERVSGNIDHYVEQNQRVNWMLGTIYR